MRGEKPLAIVAGAGAGLGQSLLRQFEDVGYNVVGLGRTHPDEPVGAFHSVDLTEEDTVKDIVEDLIKVNRAPEIVVHNVAELVIAPFQQTSLSAFQQTWSSMVQSAFVLAQSVLPAMVENGGGTFIVSGATASLRGGARFAAFASAKFALRGLTQSLAREFQPQGIHVCHVILDGIIDTPRSRDLHDLDPARMMNPSDIAKVYWNLAQQPESTWSHELDLRPSVESF